jgi:prepilin peptidase CpaA
MDAVTFLFLAPLLCAVAYYDLRFLRIPNALVLIAVGLFAIMLPVIGWPEAGSRLLAALIVFAIGFAGFALNVLGGGDVKMMAALLLFVPSDSYVVFALGFSAAMLVGIVAVLLLRATPRLANSSWAFARQPNTFPMGIAIAMCGLGHPLVGFLTA